MTPTTLLVAGDVLREALRRKWVLALGFGITALLVGLGCSLKLDVVEGALAATRLFGHSLDTDIRSVDVAFRPVYKALAYVIFDVGILFGVVACSDFASSQLAPGRIEQLLSLPIRRWELLAGTYLGVMALCAAGACYGAGGVVVLLGAKTGAWTLRPMVAAAFAVAGFGAVYSAMLAASVFVRSAALSAAVGGVVFIVGLTAGARKEILDMMEPGLAHGFFRVLSAPWPRLSTLASAGAQIAASEPVAVGHVAHLLEATGLFAGSMLAIAMWQLDRRDF